MQAATQKIVNRPSSPVLARQPVRVRSVPAAVQANSLKVSNPADAAEHEAEQTAQRVVHMPLPQAESTVTARCSPHAARFAGAIRQRDSQQLARQAQANAAAAPRLTAEVNTSRSSGEPLPPGVRQFMEPRFNADFSQVRIHAGEQAAQLNRQVGARAFTVGNQIYFSRGSFQPESSEGRELIAHELTHTIQQGAMIQRKEDTNASRNGQLVSATSGGTMLQRESWWRRAGRAIGGAVSSVIEFGESVGWRLLNEYAPELVPIIQQGPFEWLKEKISNAVETGFNTLVTPVRSLTGVASSLIGHFTNLVAWIRQAAARIANGDCGAVTEAAEKIQQVFEGLAAPVIDRIKQLAERVKSFFSGLWQRFGAPVWSFLERIGGAAWERVKQLGRWIWEKTAPIRSLLSRAWTWIKNKLGIGEGPEGQDGILQWVKRKAQTIWDERIKPFYERFRRPILVVAGVLVMLSPAGPVIAIGAAIGGLAAGIRWIRQNLRSREAVVQQRGVLQGVIIPGILGAVNRVSTFLVEKAQFISGKITQVVTGLNQAVGAVAGSILSFAVSILQWIVARFQELARWAGQGLMALANGVASALRQLSVYLQPILDVLRQIAQVVGNIMRLPLLLAGRLWNLIPACIRNPFINFFIPLILRQIAFFRELAATPEAWQQTRAQVMQLIQQVFRDFDLIGAIRTAFRIVVRALRIPVELMGQLLDKAASAWDAVIAAPLRFIENSIKAILQGMGRFMRNILSHLWFGVQGWLLNAVSQSGVAPPTSWTPRAIFGFVLDVLGISVDHVIDLIDRRVPGAGRPLRGAVHLLSGALEWIRIAIDQGPRGLWNHLVDRLGNLGTMVLESAVGWIMTRVIVIVGARIAALAASAGLSAVLEAVKAVYSAIQTAIEYMPRILGILIRVFDTVVQIARGVIAPAAAMVESGFRMAMPVVIGFLANYAGLGGIGGRIREIILNIRTRVDNAILGLIDRVISAIRRLYDMLRRGVQAVTQWWRTRRRFSTPDGQSHSVLFRGDRRSARLFVESDPIPFETFVQNVPSSNPAKARAVAIARQMDDLRNRASTTDGTLSDADLARMEALWDPLSRELALCFPGTASSQPQYGPVASPSGWGSGMVIVRLASGLTGSSPSVTNRTFEDLNLRRHGTASSPGTASYYILGHLLNEQLGGPGNIWSNITPLSRSGNAQHDQQVESQLRAPVRAGRQFRYEVQVRYGRGTSGLLATISATTADPVLQNKRKVLAAEQYVASSLLVRAVELPVPGKPAPSINLTREISNAVDQSSLNAYAVPGQAVRRLTVLALNDSVRKAAATEHREALMRLPGIGAARINELISLGPYGSWAAVSERVNGITTATVAGWRAGLDGGVQVTLNGTTTWV
ncbi:MAG TPA: DUF4157 domain-containing protein [Gallionella sp.]|nr:DUF4157 domain-containing protein [Gallionella sp.]